jgi:hypothetical protein
MAQPFGYLRMTGNESRLLKVGDRVRWGDTTADFGTVIKTTWSDVTIDWVTARRLQFSTMTWPKLNGCRQKMSNGDISDFAKKGSEIRWAPSGSKQEDHHHD